MHLGKFWLDQIQNGPLSAIIYFHMPNILFLTNLYQIQNDRKSAIS